MFNIFIKKLEKFEISNFQGGLSLIELMVVVSIFAVITSTVIFNYEGFYSKVSLQNLTDDIGLLIRKAQSFAVGARSTESDFNKSYGIHFSVSKEKDNPMSGNNKAFLLYAVDKGSDYNPNLSGFCSEHSSCLEYINIEALDIIEEIIVDEIPKTDEHGSISISFTRPELGAHFCYRASPSNPCSTNISSAEIVVSNDLPRDDENYKSKSIFIQNTGQIVIK